MLNTVRQYIKKYRKKYQFMARVALHFGTGTAEYILIEKAWDTTRRVHRGKRRKNGDELFSHERAIAIILMEYLGVRDAEVIAAAFLHDLVEDYDDWTFARVRKHFGYRAAVLVNSVSKPKKKPGWSVAQYDRAIFARVLSGGRGAALLKCADRLHNMLTLWGGATAKNVHKIKQTYVHVLPMAVKYDLLWREIALATAEQLHRLKLDKPAI